jgi:hypothetical protein
MKRQKNVTPRTKERQDAIAAGGSIFLRAGGRNLNDNDCFVANERTQLVKKAKELRAQATIQIMAKTRADAAHAIMEKTLPSKRTCPDLKILIAWRTGKTCPSKATRKDALFELHDEAKKIQAPTFEVWIASGPLPKPPQLSHSSPAQNESWQTQSDFHATQLTQFFVSDAQSRQHVIGASFLLSLTSVF